MPSNIDKWKYSIWTLLALLVTFNKYIKEKEFLIRSAVFTVLIRVLMGL